MTRTEKIKKIFKELEESGHLKPIQKANKRNWEKRQNQPIRGLPPKEKPVPRKRVPSYQCCEILFADKLPDNFRRCYNCPLDNQEPPVVG